MIDMSILISALNQGLEQAINKALAPHIEMIERQNQTITQLQAELEAVQKQLDGEQPNKLNASDIELMVTDLIESYQPIQSLNDRVDELENQMENVDTDHDDLFNSTAFENAVRDVIRNAL